MTKPRRPLQADTTADWSHNRDTARNLWVIAVFAFWITLAILVSVYFLRGELNLILVSIALGLMILGVWLKVRYQLIVRKGPDASRHGEDH